MANLRNEMLLHEFHVKLTIYFNDDRYVPRYRSPSGIQSDVLMMTMDDFIKGIGY